MAILGVRHNEQLTEKQKRQPLKYIPGTWNKGAGYAERVVKNANYISLKQYE